MQIRFNKRGKPYLKSRQKKEHRWQRTIAKTKRNSGESYVSKGVVRAARKMKEPCTDICRLKCSEKFSDAEREQKFHEYYNLDNITLKREFIIKSMEQVQPKYSYKKEGSTRSLNYAYSFYVNGEKRNVCNKFFRHTLDISSTTIQTACKKFYKETDGLIEDERRGKYRRIKMEQQI